MFEPNEEPRRGGSKPDKPDSLPDTETTPQPPTGAGDLTERYKDLINEWHELGLYLMTALDETKKDYLREHAKEQALTLLDSITTDLQNDE